MKLIRKPGEFRAAVEEASRLENVSIAVGFPAGKDVKLGPKRRRYSRADRRQSRRKTPGSGREPFKEMAEVASIALVNDSHRPFLAAGLKAGEQRTKAAFFKALRKIFEKEADVSAGGAMIGEVAAAQVKKYIRDGEHAPISAATADRKGSPKPLIDTGQMINSVTFALKEKRQ